MALSDIVNITITSQTAAVTQAGFGTPIILSPNASFPERVRYYTDLSAMVTDGFSTSGPEYLQAATVFAQSPRPVKCGIGKRLNKPTQRFAVTPVAVNAGVYKLKINGAEYSFTADSSATLAEIIVGLKGVIDAAGIAVTVSDQTTHMRIVANVAGAWFRVETTTSPIANLLVEQDHADPGLSADLDAIKLESNEWYCILSCFNSQAEIEAIALWAEANQKLFLAQTIQTKCATVSLGSDTGGSKSVAASLKASGYSRTALVYHPDTGAFLDAAMAGKCLPLDPGSETWMFKAVAGPAASNLSTTHQGNLEDKCCGYYVTNAGVNMTAQGKVSSGTYIDVVRGRDWLQARMQERIYSRLVNANKIAFTDEGIAVIEAEVRAQLLDGVRVGLLASTPAPKVSVPRASDISQVDKANRNLTNVKFDAVLAGAIHKVSISGTIAV